MRDGLLVGKEEIDTQEYRKREALEAENSLLRERLDRLSAVMKQIGNELG
jgi:hypothetical protein